jgi:hypothetical protein
MSTNLRQYYPFDVHVRAPTSTSTDTRSPAAMLVLVPAPHATVCKPKLMQHSRRISALDYVPKAH